jgi:RNA polymerase subunit RPABC4/transcription elongation factor Spt4
MSDGDLKICPFCGSPAEKRNGYDWGKVGCSYVGCLIYPISFYPEKWNRRFVDNDEGWISKELFEQVCEQRDKSDSALRSCREILDVCQTALCEVRHAQEQGENWYTKGRTGLYYQVREWVTKGLAAIGKAKNVL